MKLFLLFVIPFSLFAGGKEAAPADPVSDHLRYEIARAQRDFVQVAAPYNEALGKLRAKLAEASAACEKAGKQFSDVAFACVDKPAATPPKEKK